MASAQTPRSSHYLQMGMPPSLLSVSPVANGNRQTSDREGFSLPLNLIAVIVSYLDDLGDLARVTRTSRLLYYMTLPQLYEKVTLHSYPEIRYVKGRPEGFGGGSPISMALSGLSTSNCAGLVKEFRIQGAWKDHDTESYGKGRIPDCTVLLGVAVRNAIDRMSSVHTFEWTLDTKPLQTVYSGLNARTALTALTLSFPSNRTPRPIAVIPPIPNLVRFKVMNIDPLCYPDDISLLLLGSKKLRDVRMHWSPRMRMESEPSTSLQTYFGRCLAVGYQVPATYIALQNFYGPNHGHMHKAFDKTTVTHAHYIDVFGGAKGPAPNVFVDETWKNIPEKMNNHWKVHRVNELALVHTRILSGFTGLEELYLVNAKEPPRSADKSDVPEGDEQKLATPFQTPPASSVVTDVSGLRIEYLHVITTNHGATLRRLLLSDQWAIDTGQMAVLVRTCPNLEQLGLALADTGGGFVKYLFAFLTKMHALRVLDNDWLQNAVADEQEKWEAELRTMGQEIYQAGCPRLKWIGLGSKVLHIGKVIEDVDEQGRVEGRREVIEKSYDSVKDIEIWSMDVLEI